MSSPPKSEEQREGAVKPGPARPVTADGDRAGKVGSAQALEEAVLLMLAEAAEDNISQLNPRDIAQRFRPPVPFRKVEIAADHLVELGYARAIEYEHATTDYRISQNGLKWVDENFDRTDNGRDSTSWKRRPAIAESADRADPVTASGIHIHNTFAPTNAFSPTNTVAPGVADTSGRSAARAGWANVWVALGIGAILIVIGLWTGGALK
jgi:hypothetical protein